MVFWLELGRSKEAQCLAFFNSKGGIFRMCCATWRPFANERTTFDSDSKVEFDSKLSAQGHSLNDEILQIFCSSLEERRS